MKIRSLLLMLVIFLSTATIANADGAHDHAPLFGGKIFVVKDIDVELVALDLSGARPSREVTLALLSGESPDSASISKIKAIEAQAVVLREERALLAAMT